jgi:hypothetical protein
MFRPFRRHIFLFYLIPSRMGPRHPEMLPPLVKMQKIACSYHFRGQNVD